jgi:hypothetical protein
MDYYYLFNANSLEVSGNETGVLVMQGASFFSNPGRKKLAGETDPPVLMPLHPALDNASAARNANDMKFQCNFTLASIN